MQRHLDEEDADEDDVGDVEPPGVLHRRIDRRAPGADVRLDPDDDGVEEDGEAAGHVERRAVHEPLDAIL